MEEAGLEGPSAVVVHLLPSVSSRDAGHTLVLMSTSTVFSCLDMSSVGNHPPVMVHSIASRDICLNNGVPKCAGLLNGEVVAGTCPSLVGAGHDPHPASLTPGFAP